MKKKKIKGKIEYNKLFCKPEKREEALKVALDIRKFELELYWKRATYFWTFIAAAFTAYFVIYKFLEKPSEVLLLVACLGFVLSIGWYHANRGSKFWSSNWELHVDYLENENIGPLYKTVIGKGNFKRRELLTAYPFSVAMINQVLNLYIIAIWFYLGCHSISIQFSIQEPFLYFNEASILILTFAAVISMFIWAKTDFEGREEKYFESRKLSNDD